jgi:hypothetical protein
MDLSIIRLVVLLINLLFIVKITMQVFQIQVQISQDLPLLLYIPKIINRHTNLIHHKKLKDQNLNTLRKKEFTLSKQIRMILTKIPNCMNHYT